MKVTINDREIELKYSFRSMMIYEKIAGVSFNPRGVTEIMIYFYSTLLASDKELTLTFDDFVDWVDENPKSLNDFSEWVQSTLAKNSVLNDSDNDSDNDDTKKN